MKKRQSRSLWDMLHSIVTNTVLYMNLPFSTTPREPPESLESPPPLGPKPDAPSTPMPKSPPQHVDQSDTVSNGVPDTPTDKKIDAKELERERKRKEKEEALVSCYKLFT